MGKLLELLQLLGGAIILLVFFAGIWTILTLLEAWLT